MLIGTIDSNGICLVHQSSSICCGKLGSNLCRNTNINYYVSAFCLLALGIGDVSVVSNNGSGMSVSYCQLSELINKAKTTVYNGLRGCILRQAVLQGVNNKAQELGVTVNFVGPDSESNIDQAKTFFFMFLVPPYYFSPYWSISM